MILSGIDISDLLCFSLWHLALVDDLVAPVVLVGDDGATALPVGIVAWKEKKYESNCFR